MANVLLINPPLTDISTTPFYVMPVGLLSLASYLQEYQNNVSILDLNITKRNFQKSKNSKEELYKEIKNKLQLESPDLIGLSIMVAGQFKISREVCQYIKQILPEVKIAVGGPHVSQFPSDILENCPEIDFVLIGESENQFLNCIESIKTKKFFKKMQDGIAYRECNKIIVIPKTGFIENINALPPPAYNLLDFEGYRHDTKSWHNPYKIDFGVRVPIITSRGCPNLCNFCSLAKCMGLNFRSLSATKTVDLIQNLHEKHGTIYFAIFDANFTENYARVMDICEEIKKRNLKIYLDLPTGMPINATAPTMIAALAEVGLLRTCISIESGDAVIRNKHMMKNIEQDEIFKIVEAIRSYPQIFLLTDFVIGMPEETTDSLEASVAIIKNLDCDDLTLSLATPYPGTKLYEQCKNDNLLFDVDITQLWQADWYNHANVKKFVIKPYNLTIEILQDYRNQILSFRDEKIFAYEKRMEKIFGVVSKNYSKNIYSNQKIDNYSKINN